MLTQGFLLGVTNTRFVADALVYDALVGSRLLQQLLSYG
jgi:hypothetical protein